MRMQHLLRLSKAKKQRKHEASEARYLERQRNEQNRELVSIEEPPAIAIAEVSRWQRMKKRVSRLWKRGDAA